jgi:uncharacterized Zn finger protein
MEQTSTPRAYCETCRSDVPVEVKHMVYKSSRKKFTRVSCSECGRVINDIPGTVNISTDRMPISKIDPNITR